MLNLDSQELIHLAMYAASKDNHDDALGYLKQALEQEPDNANATLLLAAEYAEIGLFERAVENFDKTIQLDPNLLVAQIQVALLLIMLDKLEQAARRLKPLLDLPESDYFYLFAQGLSSLMEENLSQSRAFLQQGCEKNTENLPLNEDIQRIIEQINVRMNEQQTNEIHHSEEPDSSALLDSLYTQ